MREYLRVPRTVVKETGSGAPVRPDDHNDPAVSGNPAAGCELA